MVNPAPFVPPPHSHVLVTVTHQIRRSCRGWHRRSVGGARGSVRIRSCMEQLRTRGVREMRMCSVSLPVGVALWLGIGAERELLPQKPDVVQTGPTKVVRRVLPPPPTPPVHFSLLLWKSCPRWLPIPDTVLCWFVSFLNTSYQQKPPRPPKSSLTRRQPRPPPNGDNVLVQDSCANPSNRRKSRKF